MKRPQFTLRALLVAIILIACIAALFGFIACQQLVHDWYVAEQQAELTRARSSQAATQNAAREKAAKYWQPDR
jgi:hypothetical protein